MHDLPARRRRDSALRIERALSAAADGLTMRELVAATGLHENALRRALARLAAADDVQIEPHRHAARGRPQLRYRMAGAADVPFREFLPLLLELVTGSGVSDDSAYAVGRSHRIAARGSPSQAVKTSLARLGFAPREEPASRPGATTFVLGRCPFSETVTSSAQGRRICALHHGLLAGVAEGRGGRLREFVINDPRVAPCRVAVLDDGTCA